MSNHFQLFVGQGVKHAAHGYGVVQAIKYDERCRPIAAAVRFTGGEHALATASLGTAAIPIAAPVKDLWPNSDEATNAEGERHERTQQRKRVRCRPNIEVGATASHAKGRVTILIVGQYLCLVSFRNQAPYWVQPRELWVNRYLRRPEPVRQQA